MEVSRITMREIRLPLVERFEISSGATRERRILLLELASPDGARTWSECVAGESPHYSPETVDTAWMAIGDWLGPRILGRELAGPSEAGRHLSDGVRGHRMARAAVEMGVWGLAAEQAGTSLSRLLGGTREAVETGISLGIQSDPETLVERAVRELEAGYRKLKMKVRAGADVEFVGAVRKAVGEDAPLAVDANGAYRLEEADALKALEALDRLGLLMIEQPLAADDLVRHARLQERLRTPICLDESVRDPRHVEDMAELGAGRIVNLKPGRVGGLGPSLEIHELCRARGLGLWCGGMLETGVGRAYNVALASLPGFDLPGDLSPSRRYWAEDVVEPEWTMEEGRVRVPRDRAGLGVEVRRDRIEELTVREERLG